MYYYQRNKHCLSIFAEFPTGSPPTTGITTTAIPTTAIPQTTESITAAPTTSKTTTAEPKLLTTLPTTTIPQTTRLAGPEQTTKTTTPSQIVSSTTLPTTTKRETAKTSTALPTTTPQDMCPAGQSMEPYTRSIHSGNPSYKITEGTTDESLSLLNPSPDGGFFSDGQTELTITFLPARQANVLIEMKGLGADSMTFKYVTSGGTSSQPFTVS